MTNNTEGFSFGSYLTNAHAIHYTFTVSFILIIMIFLLIMKKIIKVFLFIVLLVFTIITITSVTIVPKCFEFFSTRSNSSLEPGIYLQHPFEKWAMNSTYNETCFKETYF